MLPKGEMKVQKNLLIGVGNCVSVQLGRFRIRKFRILLMRRQSVGS
jgi:hypothetical protein